MWVTNKTPIGTTVEWHGRTYTVLTMPRTDKYGEILRDVRRVSDGAVWTGVAQRYMAIVPKKKGGAK